jgi:uncharacterized protein YllA (UPF0747 family)
VLVDAMLPELRGAGEELLRAIAGNLVEAEQALDSRSAELQGEGYVPQLSPSPDGGYALLYAVRKDVRLPWRGGSLPAEAHISTGAAARPLLQDFVLGSGIFVGGPAEVAYYAQVSALHRQFGVSLPRVALRAHLLAAPEKVLRAIEKYHLQPADLFDAPDRIAGRLDPEAADRMRQAVSDAEERLGEELNFLRNLVAGADPGMRRSLERRLRRIRFHFDRLEEQAVRAAARSDSERHRAIARLVETLAPGGEPQDRKSSWLPLWLQYGSHFIDRLIEEVRPDRDRLVLLGL